MKNPLTPMQNIKKLKSQIRALNLRLIEGKVKNVYALNKKIENLKNDLKIEMDNHYWENYLSL